MATQQFPKPPKKRSAAWFFFLPVLILFALILINMGIYWLFSFPQDKQKQQARIAEQEQKETLSVQNNIDTITIENAAVQKYKNQQDSISKLKKPLVVQDTAYLYGIAGYNGRPKGSMYLLRGDTIKDYEFQVNDNVFLKCKGTNKNIPYDGWIYLSKLGDTLNPIDTSINIEHSQVLSHPKYQVAP